MDTENNFDWVTLDEWSVLRLERLEHDAVARIVLDRPEKRNALSHELIAAFLEALDVVRGDDSIHVVVTKGNGPVFSAGLDIYDLRSTHEGHLPDWDMSTPSTRLYETVRRFPRVMIAQVHGYCLGGAVALLNAHDLAVAGSEAEIGMPEILRGSYGQNVTATLFHSGVAFKKAAMLQLSGRNISGADAERIGLVSQSVETSELEEVSTELAVEIAGRSLVALQHAKIAVQLGRDVPLPHAMEVDRLVTARMMQATDPFANVQGYLESQKTGRDEESSGV